MSIQRGRAQFMAASPRDALTGFQEHGLVAIASEMIGRDRQTVVHSLVVVESESCHDEIYITDFEEETACFPSFGSESGWETPIGIMIAQGVLSAADGEAPTRAAQSVSDFFGGVCAPHNAVPQSENLCEACGGDCSLDGEFAGPLGAIECMKQTSNSIAITDTSILLEDGATEGLMLLCPYRRECRDISSYPTCNFGSTPTDMILVDGDANFSFVAELQSNLIEASSARRYRSILGNTRDAGQLVALFGKTDLSLSDYSRTEEILSTFEEDAP